MKSHHWNESEILLSYYHNGFESGIDGVEKKNLIRYFMSERIEIDGSNFIGLMLS